jgi:hypothetical protein
MKKFLFKTISSSLFFTGLIIVVASMIHVNPVKALGLTSCKPMPNNICIIINTSSGKTETPGVLDFRNNK